MHYHLKSYTSTKPISMRHFPQNFKGFFNELSPHIEINEWLRCMLCFLNMIFLNKLFQKILLGIGGLTKHITLA